MATSDLAARAKEAFIDDRFELAVDLYTQAISATPEKAAAAAAELFSDRAQANIKLNNFIDAVADANKAIELDSSLSKSYFRKGLASVNLGEYQTAKAALQLGASLAPSDSRFTKLIEECDSKIKSIEPSPIVVDSNLPSAKPSKPKYRHEYYQKLEEVVLTIFAKGVSPSNVFVEFGEQIVSVTVNGESGEEGYTFQARLFAKITPANCRYEVLSTKIEIRLAKAEPENWASLVASKTMNVKRPVYPSSKATKDWDKIEAEVKKEEKDEKLDGDEAVNKFFRDIYKDADEDTRRAMMKSFVESNGTTLSTDWKDVGSKKIEGSAPDGMEMKKWEY